MGRWIYGSFLCVASACFTVAVINTKVLAVLGRPLNYEWFYYSDFLQSFDAREVMFASIGWRMAVVIPIGVMAYLFASLYLGKRIEGRMKNRRIADWVLTAALLGAVAVWSVFGQARAKAHGWSYANLANPVYEFTRSWVTAERQPMLFTMRTAESEAEFIPAYDPTPLSDTHSAIQHVVLFVLESTPAEFVGTYGSSLGVTPVLDRWATRAAVFENIYAHAPASNKSLFFDSLFYVSLDFVQIGIGGETRHFCPLDRKRIAEAWLCNRLLQQWRSEFSTYRRVS